MVNGKTIYGILRVSLFISILLYGFVQTAIAQDFTLGAATTYDQNIFDTYSPLKDQVTELQLDISHGWNYEQSYLGFYYGANLALYKDLTERNYHVHTGVIGWFYHFPPAEEPAVLPVEIPPAKPVVTPVTTEEESSDEDSTETDSTEMDTTDNDSTETESEAADSTETEQVTVESTTIQQDVQTPPAVHSDSLDQYLYASGIGAIQSNKETYEAWDNSVANGTITFRQPLGRNFSVRPSYSLVYHSYPNLSALTNVQHVFNIHFGTDIVPKSWFCITGTFGYKSYPITQPQLYISTRDTFIHKNPKQIEKKTLRDTTIYYFTTPSVSQPSLAAQWVYKPVTGTECMTQITYYMNPSSTAREIPDLRKGTSVGTNFVQNELYDDHFSFNGIEFNLTWQQALPYDLNFSAGFVYQHKKYTYRAKNLADSIIAANRIDDRTEVSSTISRTFSLWLEHTLKLTGEYHYYRNGSNEEYFVFDKSKFMIGMEYNF